MKRPAPPVEAAPARPAKAAKLSHDVTSKNGCPQSHTGQKEVEVLEHIAGTGVLHSRYSWDETKPLILRRLHDVVCMKRYAVPPVALTEEHARHRSRYLDAEGAQVAMRRRQRVRRKRKDREFLDMRLHELKERLKRYPRPPFTLQRMCELLTGQTKFYSTKDTFLHAFAKLVRGITSEFTCELKPLVPKVTAPSTAGESTIPSSTLSPHTDATNGEFASSFRRENLQVDSMGAENTRTPPAVKPSSPDKTRVDTGIREVQVVDLSLSPIVNKSPIVRRIDMDMDEEEYDVVQPKVHRLPLHDYVECEEYQVVPPDDYDVSY